MTRETALAAAEEKAWTRGYNTGLLAGKDYALRGLEPPVTQYSPTPSQVVCHDVLRSLIADLRAWTATHGRDIYVSGPSMLRQIAKLLNNAETQLTNNNITQEETADEVDT